jgi:hypothetical protein
MLPFSMGLKIVFTVGQFCRFSGCGNGMLVGAFVTEPEEAVQICMVKNVITGSLDQVY